MKLITLSALALVGLTPALAALQDEPARPKSQEKPAADPDAAKTVWEYLSGRYDADGDGKITKDEYTRGAEQFTRLDKDKNGFIEKADSEQAGGRRERGERGERGGRRGGEGRGERGGRGGQRSAQAPTEGAAAPDFQLETLYPTKQEGEAKADDKPSYESVKLSSWKGKKPVALIFGSYT